MSVLVDRLTSIRGLKAEFPISVGMLVLLGAIVFVLAARSLLPNLAATLSGLAAVPADAPAEGRAPASLEPEGETAFEEYDLQLSRMASEESAQERAAQAAAEVGTAFEAYEGEAAPTAGAESDQEREVQAAPAEDVFLRDDVPTDTVSVHEQDENLVEELASGNLASWFDGIGGLQLAILFCIGAAGVSIVVLFVCLPVFLFSHDTTRARRAGGLVRTTLGFFVTSAAGLLGTVSLAGGNGP